MKVRFWGVRGSTPTPGPQNIRYGGNTTCLEVRPADGTVIILDCGSGLRMLGQHLCKEFRNQAINGYIFLTHFHWDHIQGIPFFQPLYDKGNFFAFHSVHRAEEELKGVVEGQMMDPYFPLNMSALESTRHFYDLDYEVIAVNGARISSAPLNHPQESVAYRIEADGQTFVLATDTEPGSAFHDRKLRELAQSADALVYDAQYTPEELQTKYKGWGHSTWLEGIKIAKECGVKRLILFHHDPNRDDALLDTIVQTARAEFPGVIAAIEGQELSLPEAQPAEDFGISRARQEHRYAMEVPARIAWQDGARGRTQIEGFARDLSMTGICFLSPVDVPADAPLEIELLLPDEITASGTLGFRFAAQRIRSARVFNAPDANSLPFRIAARRIGLTSNRTG